GPAFSLLGADVLLCVFSSSIDFAPWNAELKRCPKQVPRFVKHDKVQVMLEDASGQKWTLPINDLAPEDQKLVESFPGVDKIGER
ncbi:MAG: hypothetical protein ABL994_07805, partial [Verrucomicrobiales bacterium]